MSNSPTVVPKSVRKMATRFAILTAGVLVGLWLYQFINNRVKDIDLPAEAETRGLIAAVQISGDGSRAVLISPNGTVTPSPDYKAGNSDRSTVWSPDGNRVFFISDRDGDNFNIYRWNPASNKVIRRSTGSRSISTIAFDPNATEEVGRFALLTSGGRVLEFDAREGTTQQILPPIGKEISQSSDPEASGTVGQFDAIYSRLGNSFKEARWGKDRSAVIAVMRRDDNEVLIYQNLLGTDKPLPIVCGAHIDFDIEPSGRIIFAVQDFQWIDPSAIPEEYIKDGRAVKPYRHALLRLDPSKIDAGISIAAISKDDVNCFALPRISPNGERLSFTVGPYVDGNRMESKGLMVGPKEGGTQADFVAVAQGVIPEYTWTAGSNTLVYLKAIGARRSVFTVSASGGDATELTPGKESYSSASMSPK